MNNSNLKSAKRKKSCEPNRFLDAWEAWQKDRRSSDPNFKQHSNFNRNPNSNLLNAISLRARNNLRNMKPVQVRPRARATAKKGSPSDSRNSKFLNGWYESKYRPSFSSSNDSLFDESMHEETFKSKNVIPSKLPQKHTISNCISDSDSDLEFHQATSSKTKLHLQKFGRHDDLINDLPENFEECFEIRDISRRKKIPLVPKTYVPQRKPINELYEDIEQGPFLDDYIEKANIKVTGGDSQTKSPNLLKNFGECKFISPIYKNINSRGYTVPMPIQKVIIPMLQSKLEYDIIGHAQTGSGKTASYLLPIIDNIHRMKISLEESLNRGHPYALIIAPTRELAKQLWEEANTFTHGTNVRAVVSYGKIDMPINKQDIMHGCDILVATTGRLMHFITEKAVYLDRVLYFIMDEADRLIETTVTFLDDVRMLTKQMPLTYRILLFSATFGRDAQEIVAAFLRPNYYFVTVGTLNSAIENVKHEFIEVQKFEKKQLLFDILLNNATSHGVRHGKLPKTVIFVERKRTADRLAIELCCNGFKAWSINSDRPQVLREEAMEAFEKDDDSCIVVTTSLLARGCNIKNLHNVINYDLPSTEVDYLHKIGRVGRKGNEGFAISFFDPNNPNDRTLAPGLCDMICQAGQNPPDFLVAYLKSLEDAIANI